MVRSSVLGATLYEHRLTAREVRRGGPHTTAHGTCSTLTDSIHIVSTDTVTRECILPPTELVMPSISPSPDEVLDGLPGDDLVPDAQVTMDRAFDLPVPPASVWPWLVQLGRNRAGWYLPRWIERALPPGGRGLRHVDPALQHLEVGDIVDDWGGGNAYFEIIAHEPPRALVHRSQRGNARISWTIVVTSGPQGASRVHLRFRIAGVRRVWLVRSGGELLDWLTVAGLAAGLRERVVHGR
jgi:hypothetical protein